MPAICEVRGEVYMTKPFLALNKRQTESGEPGLRQSAQFSRRFAAAERSMITASRPLGFFAYAWGEMSAMPAATQSGMINGSSVAAFPPIR